MSYQRLKHEPTWLDREDEHHNHHYSKAIRRKFHVRRKLRVKIPGLKRFLRRKARAMRFAWRKILRRLKESQSHLGDLFAGNYLFMQVTPTSLQCARNNNGNYKLSSSSVKGTQYDLRRFNYIS